VKVYISKSLSFGRIERLEVNLGISEGKPTGRATVRVETDRWMRVFGAKVDLLWRCRVAVFGRSVSKGERIFPWYLEHKEEFRERCPPSLFGSDEEVINFVLKKDVVRGTVLTGGLLERVPLIKRGDRITVIFRRGNLELSFPGEALERGFYGEVIRVKSLNTGRILKGRVVSEGSVVIRR